MRTTVGVLLDLESFLGIARGRTGNERLALYNKAGKMHGLRPFYMCLQHVKGKSALGYYYENNAYRLVRRVIPRVTHNRAISLSPYLRKKLKELSQSSIILFNRQNRYQTNIAYISSYTPIIRFVSIFLILLSIRGKN